MTNGSGGLAFACPSVIWYQSAATLVLHPAQWTDLVQYLEGKMTHHAEQDLERMGGLLETILGNPWYYPDLDLLEGRVCHE